MSIAWWKKETKTCQSKKHRIETYYDVKKTKTSQTKKEIKNLELNLFQDLMLTNKVFKRYWSVLVCSSFSDRSYAVAIKWPLTGRSLGSWDSA